MEWIIAHCNPNEGFPQCLSIEDKIVYNEIVARQLIENIKKGYPTIEVIRFSTLGSLISIPFDIDAKEFETEFNCKLY